MNASGEDRLLVRLLARGLITLEDLREMEEDLAQARTLVMAGESPHRRATWLLQKGRISRGDLESAREDRQPPAVAVQPGGEPPDRSTADRLARRRYKVMQLIGEGGMGKVYKAHDRKLDRYVALKFLLARDPEMVGRFQREAQSQARIEHPGICRVYEVGELDGRPFIAMQFIDGRTLRAARDEMTLEERLQVVRKAAEAVHEAHRIGVIHRDLNPSNIMVERSETGVWMPYLMDFGLAKEVAGPGLTQDGTAAGTPHYMSPEQACGDLRRLDRRTDIYALGATLYELLAGAPPFEGATLYDILHKAVHEEPVPLRRRNPAVPADLECVVMKCLEKEPQRRYDSARALAEDLGRYLDGEPVAARPASVIYRVRKKAAKNKAAVGIGGTALVALLAVLTLWMGERWTARERTELARRFGAEVQELEGVLRFAHMLPLHDITPEKKRVEERMASIRRRMESLGSVGRGPGLYALGRGHLALDRPEEALMALKEGWEEGYREPSAAAALGRAYGRVYQERLPEVEGIRNAELREAKRRELETLYRRPALEYLAEGSGASTDAPEYAKAFLAYLDRSWEGALAMAERAVERVPWLYEAHRLRGEVFTAQARAAEGEGKFEDAERFLREAGEAFGKALAIAPSDPGLYVAMADLYAGRMRLKDAQGRPADAPYGEAVEAGGSALKADPAYAAAYEALAYIEWFRGSTLRRSGRDPLAAFGRAEESARRALALEPGRVRSLYRLGLSVVSRGEWEWDNGRDPVPAFEEARRHYEEADRREPGNVVVLNNLGNVHMLLGEYARARGRDPVPHLRRAVEAHEEALQIHPGTVFILNNLGNAWAAIGEHRMEHGEDPAEAFDRAEQNHREAVRINPRYARGWNNLGFDLADRARWAAKSGGDPVPFIQRALAAYGSALEANPSASGAYLNAANCHLDWAEWLLDHGEDPGDRLGEAEALLVSSLELNATDAYANASVGVAGHLKARWEYAQGRDPLPALDAAVRAFSRAASIDPSYATALRERGGVFWDRARWGRFPDTERKQWTARAEADLRRALELNPEDALAHAQLGVVLLGRGRARDEAEILLDRARTLDPMEPILLLLRAEAKRRAGAVDGARRILEEALGRRPGSIRLLLERAEVEAAAPPGGSADRERGEEALAAVLKAFPRHPRALDLRPGLTPAR